MIFKEIEEHHLKGLSCGRRVGLRKVKSQGRREDNLPFRLSERLLLKGALRHNPKGSAFPESHKASVGADHRVPALSFFAATLDRVQTAPAGPCPAVSAQHTEPLLSSSHYSGSQQQQEPQQVHF